MKKQKPKNQSSIIIECMQIKSIQKLIRLAEIFDEMEKEFGIHTVLIGMKRCFVCEDIKADLNKFNFGSTPMEKVILEILDW